MTTARDEASKIGAMGIGLGAVLIVKPSIRYALKRFHRLEVRLKVTLHFTFYRFGL